MMVRKKKELVILEVTMKKLYAFEAGSINGWTPEQVIQDWFHRYPMDSFHASREGHMVGHSTIFVEAKVGGEELIERSE